MSFDAKDLIARRVAAELRHGDRVNLGIGLPTLVAKYLDPQIQVFFHSENGIVGTSPPARRRLQRPRSHRCWRTSRRCAARCLRLRLGDLLRNHPRRPPGRHGVGRARSRRAGSPRELDDPGRHGAGHGRRDGPLVTGARRVIVAMTHRSPKGSKIVRRCSLPLTPMRRVDLVVTEMAVLRPTDDGLELVETLDGASVADVIAATEARLIVPSQAGH